MYYRNENGSALADFRENLVITKGFAVNRSHTLFQFVDSIMKRKNCEYFFLWAGIDNLNIHDLRHTAITQMIRAGIPHTEIMKISGHTTMKTFMRYLYMIDETIQYNVNRLWIVMQHG